MLTLVTMLGVVSAVLMGKPTELQPAEELPLADAVRLPVPRAETVSVDAARLTRKEEREAREARQERRREARAASRAAERAAAEAQANTPAPTPTQSPVTTASSGGLPALLVTIRAHESGGNYQAYNGSGCEGYGCGGAYQMHARYASEWAARAGFPGMSSNAATWPAAVQDKVALNLFYSTNPDGAHWCNWTSYC